jgi:tellurite methyltransferase
MSALDIGCGEGRNALYLARLGCRCTCLDISMTGLARTRENARKQGVRIKTIVADMNSHHLKNKFDLIFSTNTLQFMPVKHRKNIIGDYKNHTVTDGYNVFAVFVKKPYIQVPNHEKSSKPWTSGELFSYYWDWQIEFCGETVYDCDCGGTPHKHAVNTLIAKKVA